MQNTGQAVPPGPGRGAAGQGRGGAGQGRGQRPARGTIPPEFQAAEIEKMDVAKLNQLLRDPGASVFQKGKACHRLAQVGTKESVPLLAALLTNQQLAHYARFGLEAIPDPSVDDALRDALKKVKGRLLVGVLNSIGLRKDPKAAEPLARLMYDTDAEVAQAAAAALGYIGGPQATRALQDGLAKTKGPVRTSVAAAGLISAEALLAKGDRTGALALYAALSRPDIPKAARMAALHATIDAESGLNRPRVTPPAPK